MKRVLSLLIALVTIFVLAACANQDLEPLFSQVADEVKIPTQTDVNISLPVKSKAVERAVLTWESSHKHVISTAGVVVCQKTDLNVILMLTVTIDKQSKSYQFNVKVLKEKAVVVVPTHDDVFKQIELPKETTQNITLPTTSTVDGAILEWSSNKPDCISNAGVVVRGKEDIEVIMTLKVTLNGSSQTKEYIVKVIKEEPVVVVPTHDDVFKQIELPKETTQNIILPTTSTIDGAILEWSSNKPDVITNGGAVVRGKEDVEVILTLKVTLNEKTESRDYIIIVTKEEEAVVPPTHDDVFKQVKLPETVTQNITLPTTSTVDGAILEWSSNKPEAISNTGVVVRGKEDVEVTLTLKVTINEVTKEQDYIIIVTKEEAVVVVPTHDDVFKQVKLPETVTENITLPTTSTIDGAILEWSSNKPDVITNGGAVVRGKEDVEVTLTLKVTINEVTKEQDYIIIVTKAEEVVVPPTHDDVFKQIKLPETVIEDITLPTTSTIDGAILEWSSNKPEAISNAGVVVRSKEDVEVTLTLKVTLNETTESRDYKIVVSKLSYTLTLPEYVSSNITDLDAIEPNTLITLTITPPAYVVIKLLINGTAVELTENQYSFNITQNTVVTTELTEYLTPAKVIETAHGYEHIDHKYISTITIEENNVIYLSYTYKNSDNGNGPSKDINYFLKAIGLVEKSPFTELIIKDTKYTFNSELGWINGDGQTILEEIQKHFIPIQIIIRAFVITAEDMFGHKTYINFTATVDFSLREVATEEELNNAIIDYRCTKIIITKDINLTKPIAISMRNKEIDGNNHQITLNSDLTGTEFVFHINKVDDITIKNIVLKGGVGAILVDASIVNVSNITILDVQYGGIKVVKDLTNQLETKLSVTENINFDSSNQPIIWISGQISNEGLVTIDDGIEYIPADITELWFISPKYEFTVKFVTNCESEVADAKVPYDQTIPFPTKLENPGKKFDGWYFDQGLEKICQDNYKCISDLTLYAKWIDAQEEDVVLNQTDFGKHNDGKNTDYSKPFEDEVEAGPNDPNPEQTYTWHRLGGNYNGTHWDYVKIGGKNKSTEEKPSAYLRTGFTLSGTVTSIVVNIIDLDKAGAATLIIQTSSDNKNWTSVTSKLTQKGDLVFDGLEIEGNTYFRFLFVRLSSGKNEGTEVKLITFYGKQ